MGKYFSKIKNMVRTRYWRLRTRLSRNGKLKNVIVFESKPDLSDNTKAVFDEMLRQNLNKHYKLVWLLFELDVRQKSKTANVYYLPRWDMQAKYFGKVASAKIFCNAFLEKEADKQLCVYLSHGSGFKVTREHYKLPHWVDYCIAASPNLEESHAHALDFDRNKTIGLGFPRNDVLTCEKVPIKKALKTTCEKVIVWYPTFRQHNSVKYTEIQNPIPLLHNLESAERLNTAAAACNALIVIKPHFAQDVRYIQEMKLSNICFINDGFFIDHGISSYEFLGSCDALVTDYSSVYYDYTLVDKPIALIWEDIEEFTKKHALEQNYEFLTKGGEKVYTLEEFIGFIQRVSTGVDLLRDCRREIRDYMNISTDGNNSKRVVDFVMDELKSRKG